MKSARIGYSFGTGIEAIQDCLLHKTTWTIGSASMSQSVEFVDQVQSNIEAINATAQAFREPFADEMGQTSITQTRVEFANGSRIIALPANPRTMRGYPGNAVLDEFAHHEGSYQIWAAVSRQVALGHKLRVLSTPYGESGKFYDLAKEFGLTDGVAPESNPVRRGAWSCHWIDVIMAIAEGCPIDLLEIEDLYKGDLATMQQEFYCVFLKAIDAWLSLELIAAAEDDAATVELDSRFRGNDRDGDHGFLALGVDFGRSGDRTCAWLDEYVGDVAWSRCVKYLHSMPFFVSDADLRSGKTDQVHELDALVALADRAAMDSTGIGLGAFEWFNARYPGKVMGVNFGGTVKRLSQGGAAGSGLAESIKIKTDMAVRIKQRFEQHKNRIPRNLDIRQELQAIKREQSGGAITFDAPRIEVDTPGGSKKKVYSHAEAFWAKAMADLAADRPGYSLAEDGGVMGDPLMAGAAEYYSGEQMEYRD